MSTSKPRLRKGKTIPGGKHLRKAIARLNARSIAQQETRDGLSRRSSPVPVEAYRLPGSMKR